MTVVEMKPEASQSPVADDDTRPRPAPAPAHANDADGRAASTVAEIVPGAKDSGGETIESVYFKRGPHYAIYRRGIPPQVVVAYSDTSSEADQQIATISILLPLRGHLLHLMNDLPPKMQENYRAQVADALRLGLENQVGTASALLADAAQDALALQARIGRLVYLQWAGMAILPALILILIGGYYVPEAPGVHLLLMSAGAGAIGAFLSIAIAIRARSVAIEGDRKANALDAAVRVAIGMISAAVLFLVLNSGVVTSINVGTATLTGDAVQWQVALVIGFAAGFLERLVPDLLERSAPPSKPAATGPATGTAGVASPSPEGGR